MRDEARVTLRNAVLVLVQRGIQVIGGLCFIALVPRLTGPDLYGRYTLASSVAMWFALVSGLGFTNAITRYVPQILAHGEPGALPRFIGNLLTLRVASGLVAGLLYLGLGLAWWRDMDPRMVGLMAVAVFLQGLGGFIFSIFLGLNRAERWAVADTLRRWLLLGLIIPGFHVAGLLGAAAAVVLTEAVVLVLGLCWSPLPRAAADLRPRLAFLAPYLRFSLAFLVTQILFLVFHGSGEVLVRAFSGSYAEVSYFSLAHSFYLVPGMLLPQLLLSFVPHLSRLLEEHRAAEISRWSEPLARMLAGAGVVVVLGAVLVGPLIVALLFGAEYTQVSANLFLLALAALALTLGSVPGLLAVVHERPEPPLTAAVLRLAVFWSLAPLLITRSGSGGACLALFSAVTAHSLYLTWRLRDLSDAALRAWWPPVALGAPLVLVGWLRTGGAIDVALFAGATLAYVATLILLRVMTLRELGAIGSLLRRVRPASRAHD